MRYYETLYAIRPDLEEEEYRKVVEKFTGIIEKNKGVLVKLDEWGKRKFAYLVKKFDEGYYVLMNYCGSGELPSLLERDLRLDERVLKYITIKLKDKVNSDELLRDQSSKDKTEGKEKITTEEVTDGI